ncbi:MFS transporter [Parvibaculum sp.]|uniref:MFS transporter n=1 Tax=Parvibaculum sp. TaxID=2024848 RepID=UPI00320C8B00
MNRPEEPVAKAAAGGSDEFTWYMSGVWIYFFSAGIQGVLFPWIVTIVLHESSERVGIAQMLSMLPMMVLGLFGGAVADRRELRGHLFRLQLAAIIPPAVLAALIFGGWLSYPLMVCYALVMSALGGFVMPARDAMLSRVAASRPGAHIQHAVALVLGGQFLAQVIGYLVAGSATVVGAPALLVLQCAGLGLAAFTTSRLSFIPPTPRSGTASWLSPFRDVREGLEAVWRHESIRPVLLYSFFSGVLFMGVFLVLFPVLVRDVYHGASFEIGFLNMCFFGGIGFSSLMLSRFRPIRRQGRVMMLTGFTGSIVTVLMHFCPPLWAVNILALIWGLSGGIAMSQSRAIVQEAATEALRARMLAAFQLGSIGGGPIGALLTGFVTKWLGPLNALLVPCSLMMMLWLAIFFLTPLWNVTGHNRNYTPNPEQ